MGGVVVVGGYAYVGTYGSIRKVDVSSGVTTTLTGDATATGCVDGTGGSGGSARFGSILDVATDGSSLYATQIDCAGGYTDLIRKVDISTGATTTLTTTLSGFVYTGFVTYSGGFLFASGNPLLKIDVSTTPDTSSSLPTTLGGTPRAIVGDGTYLWVSEGTGPSLIQKVLLASGAGSSFVTASDSSLASSAIEAAGGSLYIASGDTLRRYDESDGSWSNIAGAGAGWADGTSTDAWFSPYINGIASDGASLYIADAGNYRLRKAVPGTALPTGLQPYATSQVSMTVAQVSPIAGDATHTTNVDGTGSGAGFAGPNVGVVVNGNVYVGSGSSIREVTPGGVVTTVAGDNATSGCVDSTDHTQVRLENIASMATDGTYLYTITDNCTILPVYMLHRTSIATGATSTIMEVTAYGPVHITVGPGGILYAVSGVQVFSIDPLKAVQTSIATVSYTGTAIAADNNYLWVTSAYTVNFGPKGSALDRVALGGGYTVTQMAVHSSDTDLGANSLVSTGSFLYASMGVTATGMHGVFRIAKADGTDVPIAGGATGNTDATGTSASFGASALGLASDGTNIWAMDAGNYRVRELGQSSGPTEMESRFPNSTMCNCGTREYPKPVDAGSGNFYESFTDVGIPGRSPALDETRTYGSLNASYNGPFGYGWASSYDMHLQLGSGTPASTVDVVQENDAFVSFTWNGSAYTAPASVLGTLTYDGGTSTYTFTRRAQEEFVFNSSGLLTKELARDGFAGTPGVGVPAAYTTTLAYSTGRLSTVTDAAGRTLTFSYGGNGKVSGIADSTGRTVAYGYDGSLNLTDVTDVGGGNTHFAYDSNHLLLTERDPRGHTVLTNTFDSSGRALTQTDALSRTLTFDYTSIPGSTKVTDPKGNVTVDAFVNNMATSETKGYGTGSAETWTYTYDPTTLGVATVTDPNTHVTTYTWDGDGNVLTKTDALSHTTTYTYNALDEPLTIEDAKSVTTTNTYDTAGDLTSTATPLVGSGTTQTTTYTYGDAAHPGDVTSITDPRSKVTSFTYDSSTGDLLSQTTPTGDKTTYTYNSAGQRLTMVAPAGNVLGGTPATYTTTYVPDAFGHVTSITDPLSHLTQQVYDADGNLYQVIDPLTQTTTYTYDNANQLTTVTRPDATTLQNSYWPDGSLETQTDAAGKVTTYTYTPLGQLYTTTDPNTRVLTTDTYDPAGNLQTVLDHEGRTTTYGYDNADRLTSISYSDGTTPNVSYTYDPDNQELTMSDGTGTTTNTIDSLNRLTSQQNGAGDTMSYGYDLANNVTSIAYPGSHTVTRAYDDSGRLHTVTDWLSHTTTYAYDPDSNLTSETYPNSTVATFTPDAADELTNISDAKSGTPFASFAYTRNGSGMVTGVTATGIGSSESYGYSALDQLNSVNSSSYTFDSADNLTGMPNGTKLAYDPANQLCSTAPTTGTCASPATGATTYTYGADGERTAMTPPSGDPTVTYGYDQENRLTTVAGAGYRTAVLASNPVGYWRLGESSGTTAADSSGNAHAGTYSGTYSLGASPPAVTTDSNTAASFTGGHMSVGGSGVQAGQSSTFTAEAWIKTNATTSVPLDFLSEGNSGTNTPYDLMYLDGTTHKPVFTIHDDTTGVVLITGTTALNDNAWHDVVGVRNGTGASTKVYLYVDGVLVASNTSTTVGTLTLDRTTIGALGRTVITNPYSGSIDDVSYYPTALSAATINNHYQAAKSNYAGSETADAPSAYWRLGETTGTTAADSSGNAHSGTYQAGASLGATGALTSDSNKAVSFSGSSGYMTVGGSGVQAGQSSTFTAEAWIKTSAVTSVPLDFLSEGRSSTNTPYDLMYLDGSTHKPVFTLHDDSTGSVLITGTTALNDNVWHHVVGVRDGSGAGTTKVYLYVDGVLVASNTSASVGSTTLDRTTIGALGRTAVTNPFSGSIDEAAFYPTALSAATIARQYYNGTHSAPTAASYSYDGNGTRTSKTVDGNTTNFTWDTAEGLPLLASDGTAQYIYGLGGAPLEQISGSTPVYYYQDQQGSTRALTDQSGNVLTTFTTDAFGNPIAASGTTPTPLRYDGEYRDNETGFIFLRARYYDSATAQFLTRDPANTITRSAYAYTNNDSVNAGDPSGEVCLSLGCLKNDATAAWNGTGGKVVTAVNNNTQTVGVCVHQSIGFLVYFSGSGCVVVDRHGNVGVTASGDVGAGSPTIAASAGPVFSSARNVRDLDGRYNFGGGSVGDEVVGGIDIAQGHDCTGRRVTSFYPMIGFGAQGLPLPVEGHGGTGITGVEGTGSTSCSDSPPACPGTGSPPCSSDQEC